MRTVMALLALGALVLFASACQRAAELIPGEGRDGTPSAVSTPSPVAAPPLLAPSSLRLAGGTGAIGRGSLAEAELARAVVQVQALSGAGANQRAVRTGSGVVVDRTQRLILTSYVLVHPYLPSGAPAYDTLAVGQSSGAPPDFQATIVAANPDYDFAVLRVTGPREGATATQFEAADVPLGDSSTLRRGDRVRLIVQPPPERARALQVMPGTITGFRGDAANEGRAWLNIDVRPPAGAIGGPAFDAAGALVGIASQLAYDAEAPIAQLRPIARALDAIARAKGAPPDAHLVPPLQQPAPTSGVPPAARTDRIVVTRPTFAENALEGQGFRDLFDYTSLFRKDVAELHYEFAAQGVADGAQVQERWYLNGVLQDGLSSSYNWSFGGFAVVSDKMVSPNPRGIPSGAWMLEVWIGGALRASATAYVGVNPPELSRKPQVDGFRFAATANAEQAPGDRAAPAALQLLAFFNYRQASGVRTLRWVVLRNGRAVHQSPAVQWIGGDSGGWWVGVSAGAPAGVGAGTWDVEIYFDGEKIASGRAELR